LLHSSGSLVGGELPSFERYR